MATRTSKFTLPSLPRPARNIVNASATFRQEQIAALGRPVPLVFGRKLVSPLIYFADVDGDKLYLGLLWSVGEWDSFEEVYADLPVNELNNITITNYTGTTSQTADPTIASIWTDYTDTLVYTHSSGEQRGLAHSVAVVDSRFGSVPEFKAIGKAIKVYDPRLSPPAFEWSDNPALILAYLITDALNGAGRAIDWDSVATAADYCDEVIGGSKRRTLNIRLEQKQSVETYIEAIRAYSSCFIIWDEIIKIVPDKAASYSRIITSSDVIKGTFRPIYRKKKNIPNVYEINYEVISDYQNVNATVRKETDRVTSGLETERISRFDMPGISTAAEANRHAIELLNSSVLQDLSLFWQTHDEGLKDLVGDVIRVNYGNGFPLIDVRLLKANIISAGRWSMEAIKHDDDVYSSVVISEPDYNGNSLPSPNNPPAPGALTITEELYQDDAKRTYSRIRISWAGISYPYTRSYRIIVNASNVVLEATVTHRGSGDTHTVVTGPVKQDILHSISVYTVSIGGKLSEDASSGTLTPLGKGLAPLAPTGIVGYEAGQFVSLSWNQSVDINPIVGYRIKRVPEADYLSDPSSAWTAITAVTVVDQVDSVSYLAFSQPEGSYYYGIKAIDDLGIESETANWVYINVTADSQFNADFENLDSGTLTNMHRYEIHGDAAYCITDYGDTWEDKFGVAGSNWSNGTKIWAQNNSAAGSVIFESAEWDVSSDKSAAWVWSAGLELFGNANASAFTMLATDSAYPTFTSYAGTAANESARYFKARYTEPGSGTDDVMKVRLTLLASRTGRILEQKGEEMLSASGQPFSVVFTDEYSEAPFVELTLKGSTPRLIASDNITKTGFDLYAWNTSGAAASAAIAWRATGV